MSPDHVVAMNDLLESSDETRRTCAALPKSRVLAYRLLDGPDAATVHWTMTFADTVRFALEEHPSPDVVFIGDWTQMIRASRANRAGEQLEPALRIEGDPAVVEEIGPALAVARQVATVPVELPEV